MRKQYSFWPSERGLLAWDVHRLIELSKDFPRQRVSLDSIAELDEIYWFDGDEERPTCRSIIEHVKLIREVDLAYPIILGESGRVMDGMHRVAKALLDGLATIEAVRFLSDPKPDYVGCKPSELPY